MPMGIGSYEPVSGSPDDPGAAEQTLIGVVQVSAPAGPFTTWAERAAGAGFATVTAKNRLLYVLSEQQLIASEKMIGEPPAYLAVLTEGPGGASAISEAFADGRYEWKKTEAIYSQADPNRVPAMTFLHWAELRPVTEWKGRSQSERSIATRLGGILVFPVVVPTSAGDREAPQSTFEAAFKAQFPDGGASLPHVVRAPDAIETAAAVARQESAKNTLLLLGILACGAAAAWCGYKATRVAQRAPA
jgi:hypothetical protein